MKLLILLFLMLNVGCVTRNLDNAKMLMERSDFPAAVEAAPLWCEKALKIINALEQELEEE